MSDDDNSVAAGTTAPAGIVKVPGVDDVLETLEAHCDAVEYQQKFFEGEELSADVKRSRFAELQAVATELNKRLACIGVRFVGACPEEVGRGAVFDGVDAAGNIYTVAIHYDDEQRMANENLDSVDEWRESIDMIEAAVHDQRQKYLAEEPS